MRRTLRIAVYAGLGLLGLVLVLVGAVLFIGGTEPGREWLAATITDRISVPGEAEVAISRLEGPLPGTIVLSGLTMKDRDGPWLTVDRVSLEWNPLRLLSREFSVDLLQADGITVLRLPVPGEPAEAGQPFQWPTLPVEVAIERFVASPIELREPVAGIPAILHAEGEAHVAQTGRTVAHLSIVRTDAGESRLSVNATYDPQTDVLAIDTAASEREGGLIASAMGLDPAPPLDLTFAGEGPVADWAGKLEGAIGDQAAITADVGLRRIEEGQLAFFIDSSLRVPGFTPPEVEPLIEDGEVRFLFEGRTTGDNAVRVDTLSVTTSALTAALVADIDLEDESVRGTAEIVVSDGAALSLLIAPAEVTGARLDASFEGPILMPRIEVGTRVDGVAIDDTILRTLVLELLLEPQRAIDRGPLQARFETAGRVEEIESASLPPGVRVSPLAFSAAGAIDMEANAATLSSFEASTPAMTASLSGAADLETLASRGSIRLTADDLAPFSALAGMTIRGAADLSAEFTIAEDMRSVEADLSGQLRGVDAEDLPLAAILGDLTTFQGSVSTDPQGARSGTIMIRAGSGTITASATMSPDGQTVDGNSRLEIPDLAPLSALAGRALRGAADLSAQFVIAGDMQSVEAELTGELRGVDAEDLPLAQILGPRANLDGVVSTDRQGTRTGELTVRARAGTLTASGSVPADGQTVEGKYRLAVPDLAAVASMFGVPAAGDLNLDGTVTGDLADPTVRASLVVRSARVSDQQLGTVRGAARVQRVVTAPSGTVEVSASSQPGPVQVATSFALRDEAVRLDPLVIEAAGSRLTGALTAPLDGGPVTGRLAGNLNQLGPLLALAGMDGRGSGSIDLRLSGERGAQAVAAKATLRNLRLVTPEGAETVSVAHADADAQLVLRDVPSGKVTLQASGIAAGDTEVTSLSLEASGSTASANVRLDAKGEAFAPFSVATAGTVSVADSGASLAVSRLAATVRDQRIDLASPATIAWSPGDIRLSNLDLRVAGGRVTADMGLGADRFSGTAEVQQVPLALVRLFMPGRDVQGLVSGQATVSGSRASPVASARLRFSDVRAAVAENVPALNAALDADWRGGQLDTRLTVTGFSDQPLQAALTAPLRLDPDTMAPFVPESGPLSGSVRWQGQVGPLFLLTHLDDQLLTGMGEVALGIGGTVANPRLSGYVALTNGFFEHFETGTLIRSLELRVDAEGDRLVLSRLYGTDGAAGTLQGSGAFSLGNAAAGAQFAISLDNFIAVRRDDVTASVNANLAFAPTPEGARLSGGVTVSEAEIRLIGDLPPSVVQLEVIEREAGQPIARAGAEEIIMTPEAGPSALALDLTVSLPERIFVRGRGLDSEWSGQFRITGTAAQPQILGEISSVRGRLAVLNQNFELEPSIIRVSQGNLGEIILDLNIRASAESGGMRAIVHLTGTASAPEIELTSTPELPQDEILARLLFGRASGQLSALEAVQLAAAVQELTGRGGPGIMDIGRRLLGVDVFRVTAAGEGETGATVQAGRYIADDVFVGVERGTGAQSGAATVEIEVFPNVSVTSKIGQGGDANVGVKVQWDY